MGIWDRAAEMAKTPKVSPAPTPKISAQPSRSSVSTRGLYKEPGSVLGVAGAAGANMLNAAQAANARRLNATALSYQQFPTRMTYTPNIGPELMRKLAPNVTTSSIDEMFKNGLRVSLAPSASPLAWAGSNNTMGFNVSAMSRQSPYGVTGVASHELQHIRDFNSSLLRYPTGVGALVSPQGLGSRLGRAMEYRASMVGGGYPELGTPAEGYRSLSNMPVQAIPRFAGFLKPTYTQNYAGWPSPYDQRQLSNQATSRMGRKQWYPTINWLEHSVG